MSALETKPDGTLVLTVRITLKPGMDDDLINLVRSVKPRQMASTIRGAMRHGLSASMDAAAEEEEIDLFGLGEYL